MQTEKNNPIKVLLNLIVKFRNYLIKLAIMKEMLLRKKLIRIFIDKLLYEIFNI